MTFIFIIPFISKERSKNWDLSCNLLKNTLNSIKNQTNKDYKVIIVGHEKPPVEGVYEFIDSKLPLEENQKTLDQNKKKIIGLKYALKNNPSHIMFLDADDLIHKDLISFVNENETKSGWYIDKGFKNLIGSDKIMTRPNNFLEGCGSSRIFKASIFSEITNFEINNEQLIKTFGNHKAKKFYIEGEEHILDKIPFHAAIYVIHNQNYTNQKINSEYEPLDECSIEFKKKLIENTDYIPGEVIPLTKKIKEDFCINLKQT